jgi:signal peptidase II
VAVNGAPLVPRNPDYAFGLVGGSATALIIGTFCILGLFVVVAYQLVARFEISPILPALVLGGTLGNVIDRMRLGAVRDFVATPWAIINVADVAVAIGVLGLAFTMMTRLPRMVTQRVNAQR